MKPQRVARIYAAGAFRPAILSEPGRRFVYAVINTGVGVKTIAMSRRDADQSPDLLLRGRPYPLDRAQKQFRRAARRGFVNKVAKALIGRAAR